MEVELDLTDNNTGLIKSQNMIILTGHLYNKKSKYRMSKKSIFIVQATLWKWTRILGYTIGTR